MFLDIFIFPLKLIVARVISPLFSLFLWLKNLIVHPIKNLYFWIMISGASFIWLCPKKEIVDYVINFFIPQGISSSGGGLFFLNYSQFFIAIPKFIKDTVSNSTEKLYMKKPLKSKILHENFWLKMYQSAPNQILISLNILSLIGTLIVRDHNLVELLIQVPHLEWLCLLTQNPLLPSVFVGTSFGYAVLTMCILIFCQIKYYSYEFNNSKTSIQDNQDYFLFNKNLVFKEYEKLFSKLFHSKYDSYAFFSNNISDLWNEIFEIAETLEGKESSDYLKTVFDAQKNCVYKRIDLLNNLSKCTLYREFKLKNELDKIDTFYRYKWETIYKLEKYDKYENTLKEMMNVDLFSSLRFSETIRESTAYQFCFFSDIDEDVYETPGIKRFPENKQLCNFRIEAYIKACQKKMGLYEYDQFDRLVTNFNQQMKNKGNR